MATPIRMKKKSLNKIRLDQSGQMVIDVVPAASDAASKGTSAQPAGPLTAQETKGLPGGVSVSEAASTNEPGTGAPLERVAPEALPSEQATSAGSMTAEVLPSPSAEAANGATPATDDGITGTDGGPLEESQVTSTKEEVAPSTAALGEAAPAAPTMEAAKDPNAQKEATNVQPNTGAGTVVGMTETKDNF